MHNELHKNSEYLHLDTACLHNMSSTLCQKVCYMEGFKLKSLTF